jgi:hypothetical protein
MDCVTQQETGFHAEQYLLPWLQLRIKAAMKYNQCSHAHVDTTR